MFNLKLEYQFYIIAFIFYTLTAFFSNGYFSADEHYQLVEFANYLKGTNTAEDLPWEFASRIRPTLQPIITFFLFSITDLLSIVDPYSKAFILRLITAMLAVTSIYFFSCSCKVHFKPKNYKAFLFLSYFLWFLPFINVRFSSETWSGLFFLIALTLLNKYKINFKNLFLIGIILGFSFLFRYQIGLAIIGFIGWLLLIKKIKFRSISAFIFGFSIIFTLGIILDSWFYKEFTITTYNYFRVNLIEDKASEFGVFPWYFYFKKFLLYTFIPIGFFLLSLIFTFYVKASKHIITWVTIPFLVIHFLIPHKEIRFLFPLVNFLPFVIVYTLQEFIFIKKRYSKSTKRILYFSFTFLIISNMLLLLFSSTRPAGNGRSGIVKKIHQSNNKKHLNLLISKDYNPKYLWILNSNFYKENNIRFIDIDTLNLNTYNQDDTEVNHFLITSALDIKKQKTQRVIEALNLKEKTTTMPSLTFSIFDKLNLGNKVFTLYGK